MTFKMRGFSPFHQEKESEKVTTGQIKGVKEAFVSGALAGGGTKKVAYAAGHHPDLTFKKAFRAARDAGAKKFTWRGKSYTTETKEDE